MNLYVLTKCLEVNNLKIQMELLSDTIFGNGVSIPGAEDITVQCDSQGFPYYKGGTFKDLFKEEFENYLYVCGKSKEEIDTNLKAMFGEAGEKDSDARKIVFSSFVLSDGVKQAVVDELASNDPMQITEVFTHIRTFTRMDDNGKVSEGSLRKARCIDKGLFFYSDLTCSDEDKKTIEEALCFVKSIGSMRNRGFGRVKISIVSEE